MLFSIYDPNCRIVGIARLVQPLGNGLKAKEQWFDARQKKGFSYFV